MAWTTSVSSHVPVMNLTTASGFGPGPSDVVIARSCEMHVKTLGMAPESGME